MEDIPGDDLDGRRAHSAPERAPISTCDDLYIHAPARRRGQLHGITTAVLTVVMLLVAADGFGVIEVFGVDTAWARSTGGGYELAVNYGTVTRPALATPFDIEVTRAGGFDRPIELAVDAGYLRIWDENGLVPAPAAEINGDGVVIWEFDPPEGDTLRVSFDARIEPAAQTGASGWVAVRDGGREVTRVTFTTRVLP